LVYFDWLFSIHVLFMAFQQSSSDGLNLVVDAWQMGSRIAGRLLGQNFC
jgi:hypothetical protein